MDGIRKTIRQIAESPAKGFIPTGSAAVQPDPAIVGRRVLVADDEDLIRQTIRDVLNRYGATVDTAADGAEATRLLRAARYDLVLSDIKMPYQNGYEVFAAAKASGTPPRPSS